MILISQPNLLFLKPRKVAGTSFEIALSNFTDDTSIITPITDTDEAIRTSLNFRGPQNYHMSFVEGMRTCNLGIWKELIQNRKPLKFWNHISATLVKERLGHSQWSSAFKISIVRNPYDMAISRYFFTTQTVDYSPQDFENFCVSQGTAFKQNLEQYFIGHEEIIDFYIKYESINDDILKLENQFNELKGLSDIFSRIKAKGQFRPPNAIAGEMFAQAPLAKKIITETCRFEIEKFGYESP